MYDVATVGDLSTATSLASDWVYPYLTRLSPSDVLTGTAVAEVGRPCCVRTAARHPPAPQVMHHFGWGAIALLARDDVHGLSIVDAVSEATRNAGLEVVETQRYVFDGPPAVVRASIEAGLRRIQASGVRPSCVVVRP